MRSHEAGMQAAALEKMVIKLAYRFGLDENGDAIAPIGDALLEAYALGAVEALEAAPWECGEVAYRHRPTPALMAPMTHQGWQPWQVSETMVPPPPGRSGKSAPGWLVRYTRRMAPTAQPVPEPAPADTDNAHG